MLLASCALSLWVPPVGDLPWRLHVAREVLAGAEVYRDVIETNPPLWFWAALPAVWLAERTGVADYAVLVVLVHGAVALALPVWDRLVRGLLDDASRRASWFAVACAALVLPVGELGQREPAAMLAALMWIALAARRLEGRAVPWPVVVAATLISAYGFALKHYFVLIPVLVELALAIRLGQRWRPVRPETVLLGACALVYGAAVVVLTPAFLSAIVPLVSLSYGEFGPVAVHGAGKVLAHMGLGLAICGLALWCAVRAGETRPLVWGILAAGLVFALLVVVQMKGWRYHMLAAQGCALVGLGLVLAAAPRASAARLLTLVCWLFGLAVMVGQPLRAILADGGVRADPAIETWLDGLKPGTAVMILDTAPETAFLGPVSQGFQPASRHYALWMLPGLAASTDPRAAAQMDTLVAELADDIACQGASWIAASTSPPVAGLVVRLTADPHARAALATDYQHRPGPAGYQLWQRRSGAPPPAPCRPLR
jgi:hypothetical protein